MRVYQLFSSRCNKYNRINKNEGVGQISKTIKLICLLLALIIVVVGCSSSNVQEDDANLLLTGGWLPVVTLTAGLVGLNRDGFGM